MRNFAQFMPDQGARNFFFILCGLTYAFVAKATLAGMENCKEFRRVFSVTTVVRPQIGAEKEFEGWKQGVNKV